MEENMFNQKEKMPADSERIDWKEFLLELDRQRPNSDDPKENIDWWHFTAHAHSLNVLDRSKMSEAIKVSDRESVLEDFEKLRSGDDKDKYWNLPIYAARLKELGWGDKEFNEDNWRKFEMEMEARRKSGEWWHLSEYLSALAKLDQKRYEKLINDEEAKDDWENMVRSIKVIEASNEKNKYLLILMLINNLCVLNEAEGSKLIEDNYLKGAESEMQLNKKNNFLLAQYLEQVKLIKDRLNN